MWPHQPQPLTGIHDGSAWPLAPKGEVVLRLHASRFAHCTASRPQLPQGPTGQESTGNGRDDRLRSIGARIRGEHRVFRRRLTAA